MKKVRKLSAKTRHAAKVSATPERSRRKIARLRKATAIDKRRHGKDCQGEVGCRGKVEKIFESVCTSDYGFKRIMLCKTCCKPELLFSSGNKVFSSTAM
jgi:hypothetical protein